jgi:aspartyl-tRNA(Asn)/glutamyl-tRNA(Gln) amidotransferase subunit A
MLEAVAGHDPLDATSIDAPVPRYRDAVWTGVAGMKIGLPDEYFVPGTDPEVTAAVQAAIGELEKLGAQVRRVSLPHTQYAIASYYLIATAEASSNLARYDGVRYGHRASPSGGGNHDLAHMYATSRGEGFGAEVKRRIMLGTYALRSGYYDAYYRKAQEARALIKRDFDQAFADVDLIATPTSPTAAFPIGAKVDDPLAMYLADIFTISCNLAGLPGMSVPCGFTTGGLPIGLQLLGRPLGEATLISAAAAYERATPWHERHPS